MSIPATEPDGLQATNTLDKYAVYIQDGAIWRRVGYFHRPGRGHVDYPSRHALYQYDEQEQNEFDRIKKEIQALRILFNGWERLIRGLPLASLRDKIEAFRGRGYFGRDTLEIFFEAIAEAVREWHHAGVKHKGAGATVASSIASPDEIAQNGVTQSWSDRAKTRDQCTSVISFVQEPITVCDFIPASIIERLEIFIRHMVFAFPAQGDKWEALCKTQKAEATIFNGITLDPYTHALLNHLNAAALLPLDMDKPVNPAEQRAQFFWLSRLDANGVPVPIEGLDHSKWGSQIPLHAVKMTGDNDFETLPQQPPTVFLTNGDILTIKSSDPVDYPVPDRDIMELKFRFSTIAGFYFRFGEESDMERYNYGSDCCGSSSDHYDNWTDSE